MTEYYSYVLKETYNIKYIVCLGLSIFIYTYKNEIRKKIYRLTYYASFLHTVVNLLPVYLMLGLRDIQPFN